MLRARRPPLLVTSSGGSAVKISLPDAMFDAVVCQQVF
jgi:hypothetical protein